MFVLCLLKTRVHGNATKIEKMAITPQPLMLDAKFFSKDAEYPSFSLLSIHYISLTAQFFKSNQENMFFYDISHCIEVLWNL